VWALVLALLPEIPLVLASELHLVWLPLLVVVLEQVSVLGLVFLLAQLALDQQVAYLQPEHLLRQ
jgi:hypothetical protein